MNDETAFVEKPPVPPPVVAVDPAKQIETTSTKTITDSTVSGPPKITESHIASMSVRALIALIVIATVCYMSIMSSEVKEPLYTLAGLIVGFFFGQQTKPKSQQ